MADNRYRFIEFFVSKTGEHCMRAWDNWDMRLVEFRDVKLLSHTSSLGEELNLEFIPVKDEK